MIFLGKKKNVSIIKFKTHSKVDIGYDPAWCQGSIQCMLLNVLIHCPEKICMKAEVATASYLFNGDNCASITASWVHSSVNSFPSQCINPSFQFMLMDHGSWTDNYLPTCKPCHYLQSSCVDCCAQEEGQLLELITTREHEPDLMPKII